MEKKSFKFLVIGKGAMGLLHASFLENAGHETAVLLRPGVTAADDVAVSSLGIATKSHTVETIVPLKAALVDLDGAFQFLSSFSAGQSHCVGIIVAVKAHQVGDALLPLFARHNCTRGIPTQAVVILLHNGLVDKSTNDSLDKLFLKYYPQIQGYQMITSAASKLLTQDEVNTIQQANPPRDDTNEQVGPNEFQRKHTPPTAIPYCAVARPTGPGPAYLFRRLLPIPEKTNKDCFVGLHHKSVLEALGQESQDDSPSSHAIPHCQLVPPRAGRAEQMIKLAVNVALNGMLARKCLRDWYSARQQDLPKPEPLRVTNGELSSKELSKAKCLARYVLRRAAMLTSHRDNYTLQEYVMQDMAAKRVEQTLLSTTSNICSTVSDICGGRSTERIAMFHPVLHEWEQPHLESQKSSYKEEDRAAQALLTQINEMLMKWDAHVLSSS